MKKILVILLVMWVAPCFVVFGSMDDTYYCNRIANDGEYLWIAAHKGLVHVNKTTGESQVKTSVVGLPENSILTAVYVDKSANLWLASREYPLYKYDGKGLIEYPTLSLPDYSPWHYTYALAFDAMNKPVAQDQLFYFSYDDTDISERLPVCIGARPAFIMDMQYDSRNTLWVLLDNAGAENYAYLSSIKGSTITAKLKGAKNATSLAIDAKDNIWFVCDDGIHHYNPTTSIDTHFDATFYPEIPKTRYTACDIDDMGNTWFITSEYLLKYDGENFTTYTCEGYTEARSILCDGAVVWIYLNSEELLRFENGNFTRINLGAPMGIDSPQTTTANYTVSCDPNGTLSIVGNADIASVSTYTAAGILVSTTEVGGLQSIKIPATCPIDGTLYLVKIRSIQQVESILKVIR